MHTQNTDVGNFVDERGIEPGDDIPIDELSDHQRHVRTILEYE